MSYAITWAFSGDQQSWPSHEQHNVRHCCWFASGWQYRYWPETINYHARDTMAPERWSAACLLNIDAMIIFAWLWSTNDTRPTVTFSVNPKSICLRLPDVSFHGVDWKCRTWKWRTIEIARGENARHVNDNNVSCLLFSCREFSSRTFSCPAISCLATWSVIFTSCIFSAPVPCSNLFVTQLFVPGV